MNTSIRFTSSLVDHIIIVDHVEHIVWFETRFCAFSILVGSESNTFEFIYDSFLDMKFIEQQLEIQLSIRYSISIDVI